MSENLFNTIYNPDVLSCIANLSNDEVFTPPDVANAMLDMLPQELFSDPNTKFLDPACKSGVFLREIAKRLLIGLEPLYPDLQERIDHIYKEQLYGIAITELTSLLSRRSLYCSKYPNSKYSVSKFEDVQGNIRFKNTLHRWSGGKCVFCGASESEYGGKKREGLETHAYEFIHTIKPQEIIRMKFDVIISNPPYQLSTGGSGVQAIPLYNKFVEQAKKLNPRFITMIIPARWFTGGFGLDSFRETMLHDNRIREIHDYPEAADCFPGVQIKGGICYFLWNRDNQGDCSFTTHRGNNVSETETRPLLDKETGAFIRYNEAVDIYKKIKSVDGNKKTFDTIVSSQKPFGLGTAFQGIDIAGNDTIILYGNKSKGYVHRRDVVKSTELIDQYKVYISAAGSGSDSFPHQILGKPFFGDKGTACTETNVVIGPFESKEQCLNAMSYISTRLFRFLVMLCKPTQHALKKVYSLVPILDFNEPWTDEKLYQRYKLNDTDISFIESMIRPMDLNGGEDDA